MTKYLLFFYTGDRYDKVGLSRIYNGYSISKADLNHLHHHLLKICNKNYIFLIYAFISMLPYIFSKLIYNYFLVIGLSLIIYFILLYF